jgi:hypothetical protein
MQDVQPDSFMIWDTGSPVVVGRILVIENSIFDIEVFDMRRRDLKVNRSIDLSKVFILQVSGSDTVV